MVQSVESALLSPQYPSSKIPGQADALPCRRTAVRHYYLLCHSISLLTLSLHLIDRLCLLPSLLAGKFFQANLLLPFGKCRPARRQRALAGLPKKMEKEAPAKLYQSFFS